MEVRNGFGILVGDGVVVAVLTGVPVEVEMSQLCPLTLLLSVSVTGVALRARRGRPGNLCR
jgi:hypothetical protein